MTKAFVADILRASCKLTARQSHEVTNEVLRRIVGEIKRNGRFLIPGFGVFNVATKKARIGMNPRTGERVKVKAKKTVRFKPSPLLKEALNTLDARRGGGRRPATGTGRQSARESLQPTL
jgi:DNA-binding protein HU-beta